MSQLIMATGAAVYCARSNSQLPSPADTRLALTTAWNEANGGGKFSFETLKTQLITMTSENNGKLNKEAKLLLTVCLNYVTLKFINKLKDPIIFLLTFPTIMATSKICSHLNPELSRVHDDGTSTPKSSFSKRALLCAIEDLANPQTNTSGGADSSNRTASAAANLSGRAPKADENNIWDDAKNSLSQFGTALKTALHLDKPLHFLSGEWFIKQLATQIGTAEERNTAAQAAAAAAAAAAE